MTEKRGRTERSLLISLVEFFLIIIGFVSMLTTAFLLAFLVLLYFVVASYFNIPSLSHISISRKLSKDRINDEEEVVVEETLTNGSKRPVFLEILSRLSEELVVSEGSNHYVTCLKGKESQRIRFKIKPSFTGHFTLQKISVRTLNHLFASPVETEKEAEVMLTVYPIFEELRKVPYGRMTVTQIQGLVQSKSAGHGTEFFEIRNYTPLDEFRRINWKASARMGTLLSNEYEWEKMADIYIMLDSTKSARCYMRDYVRACASLADFFLRMGNRVGLAAIGKYWIWVRSGSGRKQLIRLVESLIETRAEDAITLDYQIEASLRVIPQSSTIILLSPMRDLRIRRLVERMRERRRKVIAIAPMWAAEYLSERGSDTQWVANAKRLVRLTRENAVRFLKGIRVTTIEWDLRSEISSTLGVLETWTGREIKMTE